LNSLTTRLTGTLIVFLVALLAAVTVVQVSLQRRYARQSAELNGLALSEAVFGALHSAMLTNDREELRTAVGNIGDRAPDLRIRVFNKEGVISYSSVAGEVGARLDMQAEACYRCHTADRPIERLPPGDRTRSFTLAGSPAVGIIYPIENESSCFTADCHAHPREKRLLGVLDVTMVMSSAEDLRRQILAWAMAATGGAILLVVGGVLLVVGGSVHRPVRSLIQTLGALGSGDYSVRHEPERIAEFAQLGEAVNHMAHDLERANAELMEWTHTLERRVAEKTEELRHAQEQMIQVERMASLGKLAAVVAHEINNPLASVVTYSRLLLRRLARHEIERPAEDDTERILSAIADESARCGEIVSNLLLFARRTGTRFEPTRIDQLVDRAVFLLKHKMDLAQVRPVVVSQPDLPPVTCDPAQVEQALLALCVNAIEAMTGGGTLTIRTGVADDGRLELVVADSGHGMDEEVREHIFEPFFTTKGDGEGKGLGLGLAVVYGIVQRHHAAIEVASVAGEGSTFTIRFPAAGEGPEEGEA